MKRLVFVVSLIFIVGLPFSLSAVQSAVQEKATHPKEVFSKEQKKLNFFQRIILKKIKRKLARQSRKKKKQQQAIPQIILAKQSLYFGLGSFLILIGSTIIFSSVNLGLGLGIYGVILLVAIISAILGLIALIKGIIFFNRKKDVSSENNGSDWIARVGIFLGVIGLLNGILTFALIFV